MSILPPGEHAAAIVAHYLKALAAHAGLRWTDANDQDMQMLAALLDLAEPQDDADTIPPFRPAAPPQLDTRVTQNLDRSDYRNDPDFRRWQAQRAEDDRIEAARRMTAARP
jgi:hypothetical protein